MFVKHLFALVCLTALNVSTAVASEMWSTSPSDTIFTLFQQEPEAEWESPPDFYPADHTWTASSWKTASWKTASWSTVGGSDVGWNAWQSDSDWNGAWNWTGCDYNVMGGTCGDPGGDPSVDHAPEGSTFTLVPVGLMFVWARKITFRRHSKGRKNPG